MADWHRMMESYHKGVKKHDLSERQADGLIYTYRLGILTRADYMEITGTSPGTASRDLAKLVELGLLIPEGKTRDRIYRLGLETDNGQKQEKKPEEQLQMPLIE